MRSIPADRPLDADIVKILDAVSREAAACNIDYLVVGATARDILLVHVFGHPVSRATRDVDFAIAVESWEQFDHLKTRLVQKEGFDISERMKQRMYYGGEERRHRYPLDLIPFGGIEEATKEIKWPPDMAVTMNVAGYEEVLTAAEQVEIAPGLVVKVASLAGLAILKIIAWSDRGRENPKDAQDLYQVMTQYSDAGNADRLYGDELAILEAADYDLEIAGACLLGRDVANLASEETCLQLCAILKRDYDRLMLEMMRSNKGEDDIQEKVKIRLDRFIAGIEIGRSGQ